MWWYRYFTVWGQCASLNQGSFMWQLHPSQQQTRKQRESLSNKNRTLQESTWKGAPQVLHYTLPEPNKLDHLAFQPRAGENKVGMSNTREQGCWLIRVISKRTADHNGIQLRAFLLQMRNQDPGRWSDFFSPSHSLATWTQDSESPSGFSSPHHFASFAQSPTQNQLFLRL